jgi:hypothetical protein
MIARKTQAARQRKDAMTPRESRLASIFLVMRSPDSLIFMWIISDFVSSS